MDGYNVYQEEVQEVVHKYGHSILKMIITASIVIIILVGLFNLLGMANDKIVYDKYDIIVRRVSSFQYDKMTYVGKIKYDQHRFRDAYTHRFYLTGIKSGRDSIPAAYMDVDIEVTDCPYPKATVMKFVSDTLKGKKAKALFRKVHIMSRHGELTESSDPIEGGVVGMSEGMEVYRY